MTKENLLKVLLGGIVICALGAIWFPSLYVKLVLTAVVMVVLGLFLLVCYD